MLRPQDKRTGFNQGNQLGKRAKAETSKKTFTFASGKTATAERVVVKADELEVRTAIHPLNPRRQESLTLDAVRDILPSIQEEGVHTEGVATKDEQGTYQLLDSSRRRFTCIHAKKDLPLWVIEGEIDQADLVAYIQTTQSVKRLSYRELGADYKSVMQAQGFTKIDELAEYLNIGRETCRKRFAAASVDQRLIEVFPDCEGIPNGYYAKLAKVEKQLDKEGTNTSTFISSLKVDVDDLVSVEDKQKQILAQIEAKLLKGKYKVIWETKPLALFDDKNKYAKVSHSSDRRGLKIELSRLPVDVYDEIIQFISEKVQNK
ncbi:Chromosome partitioning protein ParB [Vibrio crassostreae]|jgi:ParB family transcriptional regulator, chromosome partitioning protein|uniref:ParB family protein n=1 Tax=Vibrio crassostreae TaxID=246167 RepID=UPI00148D398B|nr:ParB family protein [Vibrio crassostreae]NOI55406.1 chromosome partitioning protein ParB [Vibrio crassostreae]CAK1694289.1 Chromosome partitioning protein ParB [Vibrio crassostreae]CAK1695516.1 Chromosome partitioning protein ParB [Vibrio crassostreae]CAK1707513.1 Chromosome partitioning protein ParB [Vibrio crassostreae]CAK1707565.1 Chromosome partitioning protein ParB [Vibrio crassostreae]